MPDSPWGDDDAWWAFGQDYIRFADVDSGIVLCGGRTLVGLIHKRFVGALVDMSHDKARMYFQSFRIYSKASLRAMLEENSTSRSMA
jgi:hypothetical protein